MAEINGGGKGMRRQQQFIAFSPQIEGLSFSRI
jgi:hypothetical protein